MESWQFLIIGGGLAADSAVRGIRETGEAGSVLVVSDENDPPYNRPPLSKGLWKGEPVDTIWRHTESVGAEIRLGTRIVALDSAHRTVTSSEGETFAYGKLLLATGGSPRRLDNADRSVIYYRRLSDFRRAQELASRGAEFAIIGGGFIGSEMAAALAANGCKVSLVFPGACIGDRIFPRPLANFVNLYFRKHGVDVRFCERVRGIDRRGGKFVIDTGGKGDFAVDAVVAGIGIEPNIQLAKAAGLDVNDGIVVDEMLRTSAPHVFAAGDVVNFPCASLGQRMRFEHEDNAATMGRTAGRNMAGQAEKYRHLPSFYSDLFELGYEAVGEIDGSLQTVEDWEEKFQKGIIYYLKHERVRGVLLWNTFGLLESAREMIASRREGSARNLVKQLRRTG